MLYSTEGILYVSLVLEIYIRQQLNTYKGSTFLNIHTPHECISEFRELPKNILINTLQNRGGSMIFTDAELFGTTNHRF